MRFLITGDWHIHNYPQFAKPWREGINTRAWHIAHTLMKMEKIIEHYDVDVFCHLGDWHMNASNDYRIINLTHSVINCITGRLQERAIIGIHGNHDTVSAEASSHNNKPYVPAIYDVMFEIDDGILLYLLGYNQEIPDIKKLDTSAKFSVFLLHKDLIGGKTSQGFVYKSDNAVGPTYFNAVKKALCNRVVFFAGHYHEPQRIGLVEVVGAPVQHNRGDAGSARGVLLFDTDKPLIRRIQLPGPMFHEVTWPDKKLVCSCCRKNPRSKYTEFDYITVIVKDAGVSYSEAKEWIKQTKLNATVVVKSAESKNEDVKKRIANANVLNEKDLLKKYLKEKESLNSVEVKEVLELSEILL